MDLSKLTSEVLAALSETGKKQDWLHGVVVDDVPSDLGERTPEGADTSSNMDSLDPTSPRYLVQIARSIAQSPRYS